MLASALCTCDIRSPIFIKKYHKSKTAASNAGNKEYFTHSQMEEFVIHRVQSFGLNLCSLAFYHWENMVRTKLNDDKRVTET